MNPARFSILISVVALVLSLNALLLELDSGTGPSGSAPPQPAAVDRPRVKPSTPPARPYDLIDRIARAEGRLKKLESLIARRIEADEEDRPDVSPLKVEEVFVLLVEIGAEVPPEALQGPVEKRTDSGREVITYLEIAMPPGLRITNVERLTSGEVEWRPVRGWSQDGPNLRVEYRRVSEVHNSTDTLQLPPGDLRVWATSE